MMEMHDWHRRKFIDECRWAIGSALEKIIMAENEWAGHSINQRETIENSEWAIGKAQEKTRNC
jgi:hypothetical protein